MARTKQTAKKLTGGKTLNVKLIKKNINKRFKTDPKFNINGIKKRKNKSPIINYLLFYTAYFYYKLTIIFRKIYRY